jgi:hypothetical protein
MLSFLASAQINGCPGQKSKKFDNYSVKQGKWHSLLKH